VVRFFSFFLRFENPKNVTFYVFEMFHTFSRTLPKGYLYPNIQWHCQDLVWAKGHETKRKYFYEWHTKYHEIYTINSVEAMYIFHWIATTWSLMLEFVRLWMTWIIILNSWKLEVEGVTCAIAGNANANFRTTPPASCPGNLLMAHMGCWMLLLQCFHEIMIWIPPSYYPGVTPALSSTPQPSNPRKPSLIPHPRIDNNRTL